MTSFEPLDVVAVAYPYVERAATRRAPAVVIALPPSGIRRPLLWVMMITSADNRRWPGDVDIGDLAATGLPMPSVIRPAKIAVIEQRQIEKKGHLAPPDAELLRRAMETMLHPLLAPRP